jgi:hypothetical protein
MNILPSHNISLFLVADIVTYINKRPNVLQKDICAYTGKSEPYVRSGIRIGRLLGIINDEGYKVDEYADILGNAPNDDLKLSVMRKYIQAYEPFVMFIQFCINDNYIADSARKVYTLFSYEGSGHIFLKDLFMSWGTTTGIFIQKSDNIELIDNISVNLQTLVTNDIDLDSDMAIRLYIIERLGTEIFATMKPAEIDELTDALKKYLIDQRSAIECAGRAFEDFLRRTSEKVGIDVSNKNGIGQVIARLYNNKDSEGILMNKIHSKHYSIGAAIGDIRNMAGHSLEAKTMERWDLTTKSALMYIELILSSIRSIYLYTDSSSYNF